MDHTIRVSGGTIVVSTGVFLWLSEHTEFSWVLDVIKNAQKDKRIQTTKEQYWLFTNKNTRALCIDMETKEEIYEKEIIVIPNRLMFFYRDGVLYEKYENYTHPVPKAD